MYTHIYKEEGKEKKDEEREREREGDSYPIYQFSLVYFKKITNIITAYNFTSHATDFLSEEFSSHFITSIFSSVIL